MLVALATLWPAWAASAASFTLPVGGKPTKTGLTLLVEPDWVDNNGGYRPVAVTVKCMPPPIGDRTLRVTLRADGFYRTYSVTADVELPAGAASASRVIPVPQFGRGMFLSIESREDGRKVGELSAEWLYTGGNPQPDDEPRLLQLCDSPAADDLDVFTGGAQQPQGGRTEVKAATRLTVDVPESWLELSALDFIALSADEMELLAKSRPRSWQAICDWTAAGGNLCVYGVGAEFERQGRIDELLAARPAAESAKAGSAQAQNLWHDADPAWLPTLVDANQTPAANPQIYVEDAVDDEPTAVVPADLASVVKQFVARQTAEPSRPFRWRVYRLGRVVALAAGDMFPATGTAGRDDRIGQWAWVREIWAMTVARGPRGTAWSSTAPIRPSGTC